MRELRHDQALRTLLRLESVPTPTALGSWLRRMGGNWEGKDIGDSEGLRGLATVRRAVLSRHLSGVSEVTVDIDATAIQAEKRHAKMTYQGFSGYTPILAFIGGCDAVLWEEFRAGNVSPNSRAVECLDACANEAKSLAVKIAAIRSDSAFYQAAVFNWAEKRQARFAIAAPLDPAVDQVIQAIPSSVWKPFPDSDREYAETVHSMNGTEKSFRLVVQRWKTEKSQLELFPFFYHVIATNRPENPLEIIGWYNQRGNCEDAIGELKHGFGTSRLPCGSIEANAVWFRLATIAFNLKALFDSACLSRPLVGRRVATLRWRLYGIAAKVVRSGRRWILKLAASKSLLDLFREIRARCYRLRYAG